jgi:response regulator of citrate/malate metabolism
MAMDRREELKHQLDLVVLDIYMPRLDGLSFGNGQIDLEKARSNPPDLVVAEVSWASLVPGARRF